MLNPGDKRFVVKATEYVPGKDPVRSRRQFSDRKAAERMAKELLAAAHPVKTVLICESIEEEQANFND